MRLMAACNKPQQFIDLGFKLGFGGALTFERTNQLRLFATQLPLWTPWYWRPTAPDIPPHWLYVTAEDRAQGHAARAQCPRPKFQASPKCWPICAASAWNEVHQATTANVQAVLGLR
jgi:TatD DNase family protein